MHLYVKLTFNFYDVFYMFRTLHDCLYRWHINRLYRNFTYNHIPEGEPSGPKHVEDLVKIKILVSQMCVLLVYVIRLYYNVRCKKHRDEIPRIL